MFIRFYKPFTKGFRNRKTVTSFLSSAKLYKKLMFSFFKKKIYKNHKFLSNSNTIYNINMSKPLNGLSLLIKVFKVSYSGSFFGFFQSFDKAISLKKLCYGWSIIEESRDDIDYKKFLLTDTMFNSGKYYLFMYDYESKFCFLNIDLFKKVYATSPGTFCYIQNIDDDLYKIDNGFFFIKIPSSKSIVIENTTSAICGRVSNVFNKHCYFSTFSKKFKIKKKFQHSRGIAKNPVDHPNGGRSKIKHPFKNPWGRTAKKNK